MLSMFALIYTLLLKLSGVLGLSGTYCSIVSCDGPVYVTAERLCVYRRKTGLRRRVH
jgi:hypothetical protein